MGRKKVGRESYVRPGTIQFERWNEGVCGSPDCEAPLKAEVIVQFRRTTEAHTWYLCEMHAAAMVQLWTQYAWRVWIEAYGTRQLELDFG